MDISYLYLIMSLTEPNDNFGHWRLLPELFDTDPKEYYGFVYCIQSLKSNKLYIGRKNTKHFGKKSSKTYGKETNWKRYTGSSKHLTELIKKEGKENFRFHILEFYKTRGGLNAAEIEWQVKCDCLTAKIEGSEERLFLNNQIAALRWIPKEFHTEETRSKISKKAQARYNDPKEREKASIAALNGNTGNHMKKESYRKNISNKTASRLTGKKKEGKLLEQVLEAGKTARKKSMKPTECPHCGKVCANLPIAKRWHFDNCKHRRV